MLLKPYEIEHAPILAETFNDPAYANFWRNCKIALKKKDFENIERLLMMQILTVEDGNKIIGFITLQFRTNTTIFSSIIILKQFHGKGYSEKIISAGIVYGREQRYHKIVARVNSKDFRFIEKLKSIGFIEEGLFKQERWSSDGWQDELMMALIIGG